MKYCIQHINLLKLYFKKFAVGKVLFLLCGIASSAWAQTDPHFSMVKEAPLLLNPSNIGNMDGSYRGGLNYRNQWNSVDAPFETTLLFADLSWTPKILNNRKIAWGIQLINDRLGNSYFQQNIISTGFAMPFYLDQNRIHVINAGISAQYQQINLDASQLNFESGFNYVSTQFSGGNNPLANNQSAAALDFALGGEYQYHDITGKELHAGLSIMHLFQPSLALGAGQLNKLQRRWNTYLSGIYPLNNQIHAEPLLLWMQQGSASNVMVGSEFSYSLGRQVIEKIDLRAGAFYRFKDAMIFNFGLNHDNFSFMFAYDLTTSQLAQSNNGRGGFEFSISYVNRMFKGHKDIQYIVPGNRLF